MSRARDLRGLSDQALNEKLNEARQELFNLRFQHSTGQLEDTAALARAKRDLARALTVARERNIDIERELRRQTESG